jgi:hypothetical protein
MKQQNTVLDKLGTRADKTCEQLSHQGASIQELQTISNRTCGQTNSILAKVTQVLSRVTLGQILLSQIREQLQMIIRLYTSFTTKMRAGIAKLLELFFSF